ncbi:chemotaxis protein [Pseudomonas rhizosphaerae]|uniref:Chemotaxis protein n=1 Tax=Pseudomonas rhizosphaerae TaxID=216142 RepID=A0A089YPP6_9PSED|nr:methyl-accepting chemotaxis protein [Pseudomonas rhizosphaerae]AIS18373.1 chemotaxis protein [Pseudomonas rhizosphaerae]
MRLKLLTNLNTLLLVAVCTALAATLWWSQRALEQPYLLMERYLQLSRQFQDDVVRNVQDYLSSGDALRHAEATQGLTRLHEGVDSLPTALTGALQNDVQALMTFSAEQLLAAGKLAGDPQALLVQAERELGATLEQLARYAEGNGAYQATLLTASQHLARLTLAREKMVGSGRSALAEDVERELAGIKAQATTLQGLPLLGIASASASSADDFAALMGLQNDAASGTQDDGVDLKRELASLLTRYPAELSRTRELIQRRTELADAAQQSIDAVQQGLGALEPAVRGQHASIQGEVRLLQGAMIGLILLIALLIDRMQRRLAGVLTRLDPALSTWAEGDFAKPIALGRTNHELQAIEASLNRLRLYLVELVGTIRQNAEQVAGSSHQLAELSGGLHRGALRQAGDTAQIRDALGELEATIGQVADDASQAAAASRLAGDAVEHGQQVIGQSLRGLHALVGEVQGNAQMIEQLAEESATIGGVLTVIRSIADQTNLLALNAAIEAARAGEMGRGFAVVAEEVRSLASRTTGATHQIQSLIAGLQTTARESVQGIRAQVVHAQATASQAEAADGALAQIVTAIQTISDTAVRIADSTAQQSGAVGDIREHGERIHGLGEDNLRRIDQGRAQGEQLLLLGGELRTAVQAFRV